MSPRRREQEPSRRAGSDATERPGAGPAGRTAATLRCASRFLMAVLRYARLADARGANPAEVDSDLQRRLDELTPELSRLGCSAADIEDIQFALVAFTDERLQLEPGRLHEYWSTHQWGYRRYGHTRAGEEFFERSERLYDLTHAHVLAVYRLCLVLGFAGRFLSDADDGAARDDLIEQMGATLEDLLGRSESALSPRAERPYEREYDERHNAWRAGLAIATAGFAALVTFALWAVVDLEAVDLIGRIGRDPIAQQGE